MSSLILISEMDLKWTDFGSYIVSMIEVVVNRQSVAILFMVAIISYVYSVVQSGVYCRLIYFVHMYLGTPRWSQMQTAGRN